MKPCHDNNGTTIYVGRAILCFNVHATVEYLSRNVSIGQLLQRILKSIDFSCGLCTVKAKLRLTKRYN